MLNAYKEFWKRYTDFNGRSTRGEYWFAYLWNFLIGSALGIILFTLLFSVGFFLPDDEAELAASGSAIVLILVFFLFLLLLLAYSVATFVPTLAITARRLRDADLPWALMFLSFVPLGEFALIILCCQPTVPESKAKNNLNNI